MLKDQKRSRRPTSREEVVDALETARKEGETALLRELDLSGKDLSGLDFRSPAKENGLNTVLIWTDFRGTDLRGCQLEGADLSCANLRGANLTGANLRGASLYSALLEKAELSATILDGVNLISAELHKTIIGKARFSHARFGLTSHIGLDLSEAVGLAEAEHSYPSSFDSDTLRLTANGMVRLSELERSDILRFFGNAGVDDELISVVHTWIGKPIEFFSVFLAHSSLDKIFARRLYDDLRSLGVKCWFDEKQILPGDNILAEVDRGIRVWDRLILVCSVNSLSLRTGWWVEQELERALAKEREMRSSSPEPYMALIPITIDDFVFSEWNSPFRSTVLTRNVGDFRNWENSRAYSHALERLKQALDRERALTDGGF